MDRFDAMQMLVASIDAGTLSAASRRLGVPLPTLSRKITDLEAQVNAKLVIRSTRGLMLTEAGANYLTACRRILEDLEEAERTASGEWRPPRGELVVTAPVAFGRLHVLPVLAEFLDAYQDVVVRLLLSDRNLSFIEDHVDIALRIGARTDSSLKAINVGAVRRITIVSGDFLRIHETPRMPTDLTRLPCVVYEGIEADRTWTFSAPDGAAPIKVPIRPRLSVNTAEAAIDAAAAGVGVAWALDYQCATALAEGRVVRVLRDFEPVPYPVHLLHAGRAPLPLKLRSFLDHAGGRLRRRLADIAS